MYRQKHGCDGLEMCGALKMQSTQWRLRCNVGGIRALGVVTHGWLGTQRYLAGKGMVARIKRLHCALQFVGGAGGQRQQPCMLRRQTRPPCLAWGHSPRPSTCSKGRRTRCWRVGTSCSKGEERAPLAGQEEQRRGQHACMYAISRQLVVPPSHSFAQSALPPRQPRTGAALCCTFSPGPALGHVSAHDAALLPDVHA